MKKLLATFLALIIVLTSGVSVFAATGSNTGNTISVAALNTLDGLKATVTLAADVTNAKVFVDGIEKASIDANGSANYEISATEAVTKAGISTVELKCFAGSELVDTAVEKVESSVIVGGDIHKEVVNANYDGLAVSNTKTGMNKTLIYNSDVDALEVVIPKDTTITSGLPYFFMGNGGAEPKAKAYMEYIKEDTIAELTFKYMATSTEPKIAIEPYFYSQKRNEALNAGTQSYDYAGGLAIIGTTASNKNTWYEVKVIFNGYDKTESFYVKDLSNSGAEYVLVDKKAFSPHKTWGELSGLHSIRLNISTAAALENDEKVYFKDIKIVRSREVGAGEVLSYTNSNGVEVEALNNTITTLDKNVVISAKGFKNINASNVSVYKNGALVSADDYTLNIDAQNETIKFIPTGGFSAGDYIISVDSSVGYYGLASIGVPFETAFTAEKAFKIISPLNGASATLGEILVYVSDKDCASVSLYANGALVGEKTATDIEGQYIFSYTPSVVGDVELSAVATYANGTSETDAVTINVDGLFNNYFDGNLTLNKNTNKDVFTMTDITTDDMVPTPADSRITKRARKMVLKEEPLMGTDSTTDSANLTKNIGEMNYATGMRNATGIVTYGFDLYFDDAANSQLAVTGLVGLLGSNSGIWFPRTLGVDDLALEPLFNKGTITSTDVTYGSDTWYRFEFVVDMRNGDHSGYMTNLSTGVKTTLAEGRKATVNGNVINGQYYFRTFAFNARMTKDAIAGTEMYIANAYISSSEEIPVISGVNTEGNDVIVAGASADILLSGDLYDNLEGAVTVTDGKGNNVELESVVYSKENKKITITPVGGFSAYNTYNVNIGAAAKANYYVGTANELSEKEIGLSQSFEFKVADDKGLYYEIGKDGANVKFAYNNAGDEKSAILIIASYSADGTKLEEVCISTENTMLSGEGTFAAKMPVGGNKVSLMLWDSLLGLEPIITDVDITSLR